MANINPSLASMTLGAQNQQLGTNLKMEPKDTNLVSEAQKTSSSGNSAVTMSNMVQETVDYTNLNPEQSVQGSNAAENRQVETNQTTSNLNYSSDLQTQRNYLLNMTGSE